VDERMAATLRSLYEYLYDRLTHANVRDDEGAVVEVIGHMSRLREAWAEAATSWQR